MRYLIQLLQTLFFVLILSACVPSEANLGGADRLEQKEKNHEEQTTVKKIGQEIVDNENIMATVVEMIKSTEDSKETVTIIIDIFNKRNDSIVVFADDLSVDDRMIPEEGYSLRQEIEPEKVASAKLTIQQVEHIEFPAFEHNLEVHIQIQSLDNAEFKEEYDVKVIF